MRRWLCKKKKSPVTVTVSVELLDQIPVFLFEGSRIEEHSMFYCRLKGGSQLSPRESGYLRVSASRRQLQFSPPWTVEFRCPAARLPRLRLSVRRRLPDGGFERFGVLELDLSQYSDGGSVRVRRTLDACVFNGVAQLGIQVMH